MVVQKSITLHLLMSKASVTCNFFRDSIKEEVEKYYGKGASSNSNLKICKDFVEHLQYVIYIEIGSIKSNRRDSSRSTKVYQLSKFCSYLDKLFEELN